MIIKDTRLKMFAILITIFIFQLFVFWVSLKQTERGRLGNKLLLKMPTWLGRPLAIGSLRKATATAKDNFTIGPNNTIVLHVWHTFF